MAATRPVDGAWVVVAQSLGANALPWFFATLAALLIAVGAAGWWVTLHGRRDAAERAPQLRALAVRFGLGCGLILAAAFVFARIADEIGANDELGVFDEVFSNAVRQVTSPGTMRMFAWITHFGDTVTVSAVCVVVAVALFVYGERWLALGWVIAIAGNAVLNTTLKNIFERVRPPHNQDLTLASGWSFPSGHSSSSLVAYGMLAYVLLRILPRPWGLPALLAATAVAFCTGASRVFLQAHYVTDVVAGFASGSAWLAICIGSIEFARLYRRRRH